MAYDPTFTANTELRLQAIEEALDQLWVVIQNTISKEQFNRLNVVRQKQVVNLQDRITALTTTLTDLQDTVNGLI
jgi:polyhydroxyalkanoate synthesis regulator phasin